MRTQYPKRFYGLHMAEGTAEYREEGKEPYKIFVGERAISNMNASFEGKPVFVGHTEDAAPGVECDGHVIRSFYNKLDGKTWCEFMVTTDKGLNAINSGWALSNAYVITSAGQGGMWHGMDFEKEVIEAEYDHLAIVDDPRYSESVIMTPEQFKEYNRKKEDELEKVNNSKNQKKQEKGMLSFFKKEKVENSKDLETMSVVLPKSKKEMDVATVINELDARLMKNEDDKEVKHVIVETENGEMSVEELINKYNEMCEKENKKNEEDEEKEKENEKEEEKEEEKKNEEDEEEKKENQKHFNSLKDAEKLALQTNRIDTSYDQVERGKNRYGSNK